MTKAGQLRKKAAELREQSKKLEAEAKRAEDESFTKLGIAAADFLHSRISLDELKFKAVEIGVIEEAML